MENLNWIAIIVTAIIPTAMGYLWYGPIFGKKWQESLGFSDEYIKSGNMGAIFGIAFIMAIILSMAMAVTIENVHGVEGSFHTFKHGALHGSMLGALLAVPVLVSNSLFQRNNATNILINVGYWIITMALMGGVLDVWQ